MKAISKNTQLVQACPILDWIDRELADNYTLVFSDSRRSDILLELRHHFSSLSIINSPNKLVGGFYQLLPKIEKHYYLLGFRIRQWFSLHYSVKTSDPLERVPTDIKPLLQTCKNLKSEKKIFFENSDYQIPFEDIRVELIHK